MLPCFELKPGPNKDENCREFRLSFSFGLKLSCALAHSHRLSHALIDLKLLKFFVRVDKSFLLFGPSFRVVWN